MIQKDLKNVIYYERTQIWILFIANHIVHLNSLNFRNCCKVIRNFQGPTDKCVRRYFAFPREYEPVISLNYC